MTLSKLSGYLISVLIGLSTFMALYIAFIPIQVLTDWHVTVPEQSYNRGDTVHVTSVANKIRPAAGKVTRVLECDQPGDRTTSYTLNSSDAANRVGYTNRSYDIVLPRAITYTPTNCRIIITINYKVFSELRTVSESTVSNDIKVN